MADTHPPPTTLQEQRALFKRKMREKIMLRDKKRDEVALPSREKSSALFVTPGPSQEVIMIDTPDEQEIQDSERTSIDVVNESNKKGIHDSTVAAPVEQPRIPRIKKRKRTVPDENASSSAAKSTATDESDGAEKRSIPDWYTSPKANAMKVPRDKEARLRRIKEMIRACKDASEAKKEDKVTEQIKAIRAELHFLEFFKVDEALIKKTRLLEDATGLPQVFDDKLSGSVKFPWDVQADAEELYIKWHSGIFDTDILRGIDMANPKRKGKDGRKGGRIARDWSGRAHAAYFGNGNLINGQWWPNQICTVRDGAHGSSQGGIYGRVGEGAYSIVLSGSHYSDKDEGEELWYCGTDSSTSEPTDATKRMIESADRTEKRPVRVLRSHNLGVRNPYRPVRGYRYDGLYDVLGFEILNHLKAVYRFHLRRCSGQQPIRYQGVEARPTAEEINSYNDIRSLIASSE